MNVATIIANVAFGTAIGMGLYTFGKNRGKTGLGIAGMIVIIIGHFLAGIFASLPIFGVFALIIYLLAKNDEKQSDWNPNMFPNPQEEVPVQNPYEQNRPSSPDQTATISDQNNPVPPAAPMQPPTYPVENPNTDE